MVEVTTADKCWKCHQHMNPLGLPFEMYDDFGRYRTEVLKHPPMRFIFMHRGNGLWPRVMVPPSFDPALMEQERRKQEFEVDLDGHDLPDWMSPLADQVDHLTILQGLSGKMFAATKLSRSSIAPPGATVSIPIGRACSLRRRR